LETLRLFPPVHFIPKIAMQDALIPAHTMSSAPGAASVPHNVFVPRGARAGILVSALHYNRTSLPSPTSALLHLRD